MVKGNLEIKSHINNQLHYHSEQIDVPNWHIWILWSVILVVGFLCINLIRIMFLYHAFVYWYFCIMDFLTFHNTIKMGAAQVGCVNHDANAREYGGLCSGVVSKQGSLSKYTNSHFNDTRTTRPCKPCNGNISIMVRRCLNIKRK